MRNVSVREAEAQFSALLSAVEAGEEIAVTRHGKIVARLVPDVGSVAADAFRDFWFEDDLDLEAPDDPPAEEIVSLDNQA